MSQNYLMYPARKLKPREEKVVKCPDCNWSEFQDGEVVGMTPCYTCNSTGYIDVPVEPKPEEYRGLD